jgi:MFS family permease
MLVQIGTLIVATGLIQLANGFFGTFISLRVASAGFDPGWVGPVLSAYFAGFTIGALRCGAIIGRVGHIRGYAAFAGLVVCATAAMPLLEGAVAWLVLRAIIGFGCAGIFMTAESWLNAKAEPASRGRVFSLYMVATFLSLAGGQLLVGSLDLAADAPFTLIVVLFAAALVMVSTTRAEPPRIAPPPPLPYGMLTRAAPVAVAGCALSGVISGSFYALVPAWMQGEGHGSGTIALVMLAAVLGGLAFQIPVGRLSDRVDRRLVLVGLGLGLAAAAAVLLFLPPRLALVLPPAAMLGGFMSTLYPVAVAHAHDRMPADSVVAVSARLILVSGLGSVAGPLVASGLMARYGIDGVLWLMASAALLLAALAGGRAALRAAPRHAARTFAVLAPQASPLAHDPAASAAAPVPRPAA